MAGRPTNTALKKRQSLALAQQVCLEARKISTTPVPPPNHDADNTGNLDADDQSSGDENIQHTRWSGGVSHHISSDEEPIVISDDDDDDDEEVVEELSGSELEDAVQQHRERSVTVGQPVTLVVANSLATRLATEPQGWRKASGVQPVTWI